ncbi:hypothetical protein Aab01nite_76430 [Paractinoplanes abujensis]|uniref:Uncharacterized protein n=1 Tax=Paractinoplanes abujensis TaxID=882441 RepID=A0A7W7G390_9ACTN|nr:hypothetical protein [Actinoplanes abujensis]MBB4692471.1 hypothetical protein [Actinoplanes abujensis]GID24053.1 hypothetical protein Aab01nite_76430 [Actinoplanes abujensis]
MSRGYRLLVRAYPPGRRRGELLDTFAEAGRARPTAREALNLLRHGLRARLGRPAGRGVVVVATLVALITGFVGAAVASRIAWEFASAYPGGARLEAIEESLFPGLHPSSERTGEGLFHDPLGRSYAEVLLFGHDEDFGFSTILIAPEGSFVKGDYPAWTAETQRRLVAQGWQVGEAEVTGATWIATGEIDDSGRAFSATRGGLALSVQAQTDVVDTPAGSFYATAELDRLTPGWVTAAALPGLLVFGLAGWLITGWASRRTQDARGTVRSLTREPAVLALVLLLPQALLGLTGMALEPFAGGPPVAPFWSLSLTYGFGCGLLGFLLFAVSLITAAVAGRPARVEVSA